MKEKSQAEQAAATRQGELISDALDSAAENRGRWLNLTGKLYPKLHPKGVNVSPFNALVLALHSDSHQHNSNLYLPYSEAKALGASVRGHEKGVPFLFYKWNEYVNRSNPEDIIKRADYRQLSEEQQRQYKAVRNREVRILFNIDQTLLPVTNAEAYNKAITESGTVQERGVNEADVNDMRERFDALMENVRDKFVQVKTDGSGMAHYDAVQDAVYLPEQSAFESYEDYVQEAYRQVVSATGHPDRLGREGVAMNGNTPSEDAAKRERLVTELSSAALMLSHGKTAKLSPESLKMVDYWQREIKEDPHLMDAIERDVNNAVSVVRKVERGEKIEYNNRHGQQQTAEQANEMPKHYFVADEIKQHPDKEGKIFVLVIDQDKKAADVILPAGASLEVNNEVPGMSKQRIEKALKKEGIESVRFYNPDGALGYRPDDSYFADKQVQVAKLKNWDLYRMSTLDTSEAVKQSSAIGFEQVQMIQDDKNRWALYLKPEGMSGYSVYPDKADVNRFFTSLKQSMDGIDTVRMDLAQKYYALAESKPELKVDLFTPPVQDVDLNRVQKVAIFKTENNILCSAVIDDKRLKARPVTPQQWQRLWLAEDRNDYKRHLAASLFADVLKVGEKQEQNAAEKQEDRQTQDRDARTAVESNDKGQQETEQVSEQSALQRQFRRLKEKHPDAILLFRTGDFYTTYDQDAKRSAEILGINVVKPISKEEKGMTAMASFPHHALDIYLPKLVRAGARVAICDQIEAPKQTLEQRSDQQQSAEQEQEQQRSGGMKR